MSNFTFLTTNWPDLYETAREAEQNLASTPLSHRLYARRSLERAVKWLYANDSHLKQPYADTLAALGFGLRLRSVPSSSCPVPERSRREPCLFPNILTILKISNLAVHSNKPISSSDSLHTLKELFQTCATVPILTRYRSLTN